MTLHMRDPQSSTSKHLKTINKFNNVSELRINFHRTVGFLYTNNKHKEKTIMTTILFKITPKK